MAHRAGWRRGDFVKKLGCFELGASAVVDGERASRRHSGDGQLPAAAAAGFLAACGARYDLEIHTDSARWELEHDGI